VLKAGLNIISLSELSRDFRKKFQNKMRPPADDVKSRKEEGVNDMRMRRSVIVIGRFYIDGLEDPPPFVSAVIRLS
jgi:hypothetical protein